MIVSIAFKFLYTFIIYKTMKLQQKGIIESQNFMINILEDRVKAKKDFLSKI
jgi:hypothetical protein|tara:strand:+ start:309 stop:464 length:156 start_codon:yes stop_codon:yes gene_type:complete